MTVFDSSRRRWCLVHLVITLISIFETGRGTDLGPPTARVSCETTKGNLLIDVHSDWAPLGAERFIALVKDGFYTDIAFFRCVKRFLTQFGISVNPLMYHWHEDNIPDDPNLHLGIQKNYVSFAGGGPNTRSTQIFIAFEYLDFLGVSPWETPFGVVVEGQETLDALYKEYGDMPPFGKGPNPQKIHNRGNSYIHEEFPKIDFLQSCKVIDELSPEFRDTGDEKDSAPIEDEPEEEEEREMGEREEELELEKRDELEMEEREAEKKVKEEKEKQAEDEVTPKIVKNEKDEHEKSIPRGPDELEKLSVFERKTRFRRGGLSLKDQLEKSQGYKTKEESEATKAEKQKVNSAMYAVIILSILIFVLYIIHREKAESAAVGKRS